MVQWQHENVGADADAVGAGRDRGGYHKRRGQHSVVGEVVRGQPHHVVAETVGFFGFGQALRVVLRSGRRVVAASAEVVHDAEPLPLVLVEDHADTEPGRTRRRLGLRLVPNRPRTEGGRAPVMTHSESASTAVSRSG
jgi:hypothetical protein